MKVHLIKSLTRQKLPYFLVGIQVQLDNKRFPYYLAFQPQIGMRSIWEPTLVGKSRFKAFKSIKDRVWRLHTWKVKFLSQAEKEILLKAMIQAIPMYNMSIFQLPLGLCKEINGMMQKFWWDHQENKAKIHWMS
jgi:hypothetical protein